MDSSHPLELPLLDKPLRKDFHYIYYNNIAILISTISFFYNILEGAVSIYFGEVTDSLSLFFFGVQSLVEVLSSVIVLWKVMTSYHEDTNQIRKEKFATIFIGCLFIFLTIGIFITGIFNLVDHNSPTTTIPNIIVSACATTIMLFLYYAKKKLARELNSSTIQSDAQCSLACIRITILLLIGSIIYHFWDGGWWIDGSIALILGVLFGKEGISMLIWAQSKDFSGGCCGGCAKMPQSTKPTLSKVTDTTSLKNEYQRVESADQDIEAQISTAKVVSGGGCCKSGKCSKKEEKLVSATNPMATSTKIVSNDFEGMNLKANENVVVVPQKAAGGCCKSGVCSKKAQNISDPVPIQVDQSKVPQGFSSNENRVEVVEEKSEPPKAAGGCCKSGKCSKKAENAQPLLIEGINEANVQKINLPAYSGIQDQEAEVIPPKAAGGCCKSGTCSKKAAANQAQPADIVINIPTLNEQNIQAVSPVSQVEEVQPEKKAGGCCKSGKCSKKAEIAQVMPVEDMNQADVQQINLNQDIVNLPSYSTIQDREAEVIPPKATGGCCKGGKCSKKQESVQTVTTLDESAVTTSNNIESEAAIVVPQKAGGGCCKNGVCSKKAQVQDSVVELNKNNFMGFSEGVETTVAVSEEQVNINVPPVSKGGCCKNGVCSKKKNEEESSLKTQGESSVQEGVQREGVY